MMFGHFLLSIWPVSLMGRTLIRELSARRMFYTPGLCSQASSLGEVSGSGRGFVLFLFQLFCLALEIWTVRVRPALFWLQLYGRNPWSCVCEHQHLSVGETQESQEFKADKGKQGKVSIGNGSWKFPLGYVLPLEVTKVATIFLFKGYF